MTKRSDVTGGTPRTGPKKEFVTDPWVLGTRVPFSVGGSQDQNRESPATPSDKDHEQSEAINQMRFFDGSEVGRTMVGTRRVWVLRSR